MTYEQSLRFIHSLQRTGKKDGLVKIRRILEALGSPHNRLRFVHVAGTNGKGSTTAMTASVLKAAGYRTGMFISPYIVDFRERIQIDGEMISEVELAEVCTEVKAAVDQLYGPDDLPSEFEVVTAIGMVWFAKRKCDIVVLEVGLGGRLDSTNVIEQSLVSVITSIGLDHTQYLGDTIEAIAREKCGILKTGGIVVSYPEQPDEALPVIMEQCALTGNRLILPKTGAEQVLFAGLDGTELQYAGLTLHLPLLGRHQVLNCVTVLEVLFALRERGYHIEDDAIVAGIGAVRFPARFELLSREPLVILDGAHNADGVRVLADTLSLVEGRPVTAIVGMMRDKEVDAALGMVLPKCHKAITVTPTYTARAMPAGELAGMAKAYCQEVQVAESTEDACRKGIAGLEGDAVLLVYGSLYLAGDVRPVLLELLDKGSK